MPIITDECDNFRVEHRLTSTDLLERDPFLDVAATEVDPLPPPMNAQTHDGRGDPRSRSAGWWYWLGGAVVLTAAWGMSNAAVGELGFYWPVYPLVIWAAVLLASAMWGDGRRVGRSDFPAAGAPRG